MLVLCIFLSWFRWDNPFTGESNIWDRGFGFEVKNVIMADLFLTNTQVLTSKTITDGLEWCGLLVMFFISYLDAHSDGTHSLQRIHWWARNVMLNFQNLFRWKNKSSTSWLAKWMTLWWSDDYLTEHPITT